jgi:PHD/YefM family antitoxin component YafN of YafNO toxin-antitoxin module
MSSRQFNQDTGRAKKAAKQGPVFITDRGRPAHVLLTFEAYERLLGVDMVDLLGTPEGVEEIDFVAPASDELPKPALFD